MASKKPFLMGIGGGSGSGKSTIVQELKENIGPEKISVINYDAYYRNRPELTLEERQKINFDHPDSLETQLMVEHIKQLISGESVQIPIYDYAKHLRSLKTINVVPSPIIIVDGILVLNDSQLREMIDLLVFVDVPPDLRFIRRLERDLSKRGRTIDSVIKQYLATVRPMHEKFVEPSKHFADISIPGCGHNLKSVKRLMKLMQTLPAK